MGRECVPQAALLVTWISPTTPVVRYMSAGSVEVEERGRALKVHTDTPHLVSLGGGRLSTAVTLHPLPEGRTTVGSGPGVDIPVLGSGVEEVHCHIDNQAGAVTLVPVAEMTSVDNQRVDSATRLTQGCMLCVGRSNFLRFNHPAEARLIKNSLPNSRISQLPFGFFPGEEVVDGKPPAGTGPRQSWDSWEGLSSASSEEIARYISPKVFPAGSSTVNSPAALVLGPRAGQNKLSLPPLKINSDNEPTAVENSRQKVNGNIYQNMCVLPNGQFVPRGESLPPTSPKPMSPRNFSTPSPAFDRNPSYSFRRNVSSPTQGDWKNGLEELSGRIGEAEAKRRQVESERLLEQEAEKLERQRLDEILLMCADYEKQVQWERLNKPQQNRIITNGSLPRDKRLPSPSSPHFHQSFIYDSDSSAMSPEVEHKSSLSVEATELNSPPPSSPRTRIKTIAGKDPPTPSREHALEVLENRLAILNDYEILSPPPPPRNSSKNVIKSQEFLDRTNISSNPTSPNESTKNSSFNYETQNKLNNNNTGYKPGSIAEANALSKYEFFGFNPRTNEFLNSQNFQKSTESLVSNTSRQRDSMRSTSTQNSVTKSNTKIETDPFWTSADFMASNFNGDTIKRQEGKNGEYSTEQLMIQLDEIVRESMKTCNDSNNREEMTPSPRSSERDSGIAETAARDSAIENNRDSVIENGGGRESEKFILPLPERQSFTRVEIFGSLKMERTQLVADLTSLETKVMDIEQQEEELMRELEIERALVGGELEAQNEKLSSEEKRVVSLKERVAECEQEMDKCVSQQVERQNQVRFRIEQQQQVLLKLEQQLQKCAKDSDFRAELLESCKQQQDLLEAERKSFEDLEFTLLEEEAWWLSRREELQREVSEAMTRCAERRDKLASLQAQREQAVNHANTTSKLLDQQLRELLDSISKVRRRLNEIDVQLKSPAKTFKSEQEQEKKQSQDDLERISRVTSGAPMEMSSNSLGRRTIASLQEIERNRQIHLAKQGSLVIEEERKRVSELKRRVQDEARAEWEERRQRENNCNSLNSVGSEESTLTTSDLRTESASSGEAEKRLVNGVSRSKPDTSLGEDTTDQKKCNQGTKVEEKEKVEEVKEGRPLSEVSSYSEDQLSVRLRVKNSTSAQRPLTRYLPIRGETLDLRQHIESAGHQVDLCPHIMLDSHTCRGFLHKLTSRFHHWNKRWFVFDRSRRTLTYYMDRSERKPRGGAYFQAIEEVYVDHSNNVKSPNPSVTFVIKSSERTYHLVAPSPEAMRIWVDVVFTGAEGYQEFAHGS